MSEVIEILNKLKNFNSTLNVSSTFKEDIAIDTECQVDALKSNALLGLKESELVLLQQLMYEANIAAFGHLNGTNE